MTDRLALNEFRSLPAPAKAYWAFIIACGICCAWLAAANWSLSQKNGLWFALLLAISIAVSGFKIRLPGVLATLSTSFVVTFLALMQLGAAPAMVIALISTTGQCVIHPRFKPRWYQVLFSIAGTPLPVLGANWALHCDNLLRLDSIRWHALLAAAFAYYILNTATVSGIISFTTGNALLKTWKANYLWTWPQYLVGGGIAGAVDYFLNRHEGWETLAVSAIPLYLLYRSYTNYLDRVTEQQTHIGEMASLHLRTIEALALAIDAKDDTTAAHLRRVQVYAAGIGEMLRLSSVEMQALHAAALLHDVGKLAVPEYIISKPGKLTAEEFEKMKIHPVVGAEILDRVNFPYPVVPIVRCHHEKFDGTGYPDGLSGEQIPIGARILSAVDCFDALASDRQYRKAVPLEEAMRTVAEQSGKAYDPVIVRLLQDHYKDLEKRAKEDSAEPMALTTTKVRVERGIAPATGLAETGQAADTNVVPSFSSSIAGARHEIQLLTQLINDLGNSLSLDDTLALLAVRLEKAVRHDAIVVYLERDGKLVPRFVKGESSRFFSFNIPIGQGLSGWVAENDKPIVNGNPAAEAGFLNDPAKFTLLRSAICIPLRSDNASVGVLSLYSLSPDAFTSDHKRMLLAVASKAAHAIRNSLRFQSTATAADTDELTGLANARSLFSGLEDKLSGCAQSGTSFAVILMDLDGFKQANDRYGHLAGNRILQSVARGLRENVRGVDLVARLGGDEFVIVQADASDNVQELTACINGITERLAVAAGCEPAVTLSAGIALYPADGTDAETLLERADERMYESKRRKKQSMVA
jgi:diguanylate cyclase (GGDEF)-like protein/putative nucleotidyltransferase with HDIG domain